MSPRFAKHLKALPSPTRAHLASVAGVEDFIRSICEYVSPKKSTSTPESVAIIYRAFFEALHHEGLLCSNTESRLVFQFREHSYVVDLSHGFQEDRAISGETPDELVTSATLVRSELFLQGILDACEVDGGSNTPRSRSRPGVELTENTTGAGRRHSNTVRDRVAMLLQDVEMSERQLGVASNKVNLAYFALGQVYMQVAKDHCGAAAPNISSTAFHKIAFPYFMDIASSIITTGRAGMKKKMERARKFFALVNLFGEKVLSFTSAVNVFQIDKLTFKMILLLQSELAPSARRLRERIEKHDHVHKRHGKRSAPDDN